MAAIVYTLLFVSIMSIPCVAFTADPPLAELEEAVSEAEASIGSAAEEASSGSSVVPTEITIEAAIDALTERLLTAQELILRRMDEVEDRLTEKCRRDAHCKGTMTSTPEGYKDCQAWAEAGYNTSGVYKIRPDGEHEVDAYCAASPCGYGTGWTVFQRRFNGSVDFNRNWANYSQGFGDVAGEFWLGLDLLHYLTANNDAQLLVEMEIKNLTACAHYSNFSVSDVTNKYKLAVSGYSYALNNPGNGLAYHNGKSFSTPDNDNDLVSINCALDHKSAWWFNDCEVADLNGPYGTADYYWDHLLGHSYKVDASMMMIK